MPNIQLSKLKKERIETKIDVQAIKFINTKCRVNRLETISQSELIRLERQTIERSFNVKEIVATQIKARLVSVIYLGEDVTVNSISFNLTSNDLIDNKIVKYHGLNSRVVDVTVISNTGINIEIDVDIVDENRVMLNFQRLVVNGVWSILIEK